MFQWTSLSSWGWVFEDAAAIRSATVGDGQVDGLAGNRMVAECWVRARRCSDLPSHALPSVTRTSSDVVSESCRASRSSHLLKKRRPNCFLRVERAAENTEDTNLIVWFGGSALDCLGDKDLLCAACESDPTLDALVPKSLLIPWDCVSEADFEFPRSSDKKFDGNELFVLKPPLGCQGAGIGFYRSKKHVLRTVQRDAAAARNEPNFLQRLLACKGRIPSWVLQTYVPSLLISGGRFKFHARAYVLVHEIKRDHQIAREASLYYYDDFEIRVANQPYSEDYSNRSAHITNGAGGSETQRLMAEEVPELNPEILRTFLAALFSETSTIRQMVLRVPVADVDKMGKFASDVFCLGALDIMVDNSGRPQLLEVNAKCPAAPHKGLGSAKFQAHLVRFAGALLDVAVEQDFSRFRPL